MMALSLRCSVYWTSSGRIRKRDVALLLRSFLTDTKSALRHWGAQGGVHFFSFFINFFSGNYLIHAAIISFWVCVCVCVCVCMCVCVFNVVLFGLGLLFSRPARAKIGKAISGKRKDGGSQKMGCLQ